MKTIYRRNGRLLVEFDEGLEGMIDLRAKWHWFMGTDDIIRIVKLKTKAIK